MSQAPNDRAFDVHVLPKVTGDAASLHLTLSMLHRAELAPELPDAPLLDVERDADTLRAFERRFIDDERARVAERASEAPDDADAFIDWFKELEHTGPGQGDALFPWLEREASLEEMRWFLTQELAGEAGFDDLVAMTQVKMPKRAKLEMARNYWDEMGRGREIAMHGPLLDDLASELRLPRDSKRIVWESLALGNLMIAMASSRRLAFQSVGALGVIELTAPGRAAMVSRGLERLGVSGRARKYFAVHATVDRKHAREWLSEVLWPLVAERPSTARALAEGALMRLEAGARCFRRYRAELASGAAESMSTWRNV